MRGTSTSVRPHAAIVTLHCKVTCPGMGCSHFSPIMAGRMLALDDLGWSPRLDEAFADHQAAGLVPARVSLEHTHIYRVLTPDGELLARVSGRLRHESSSAGRLSGGWRLGRDRSASRRGGRAHPRGAAAIEPLFPSRGRRSHGGAGDRREYRRRLSGRPGSTATSTCGESSDIS